MRPLLFALLSLVVATPVAAETANVRFVAGLVAARLSAQGGVDIVTAEDIRRVVELEGERQAMGCESDASCLAEVANAMNARAVVYGFVDDLGGTLLLQLNLFDAEQGAALGRFVERAADTAELAAVAERGADKLRADLQPRLAEGERMRVLVMDIKLRDGGAELEGAPSEPGPPLGLLLGGGGLVVLGVTAGLFGALFDVQSVELHRATTADAGLSAADARAAYADSDELALYAGLGYAAAAVLVVGGGVLVALGVME